MTSGALTARFLDELHGVLVDSEVRAYRENLGTRGTDPYWQSVHDLYMSVTAAQKEVLISLVQQVSTDVVASFLHILDNDRSMASAEHVTLLLDNVSVGGDLKDFYLSGRDT